ncbi:MAG: helix-turn-helix transcriptional regulator [Candidatus Acidiferrales bacterium]
MNAAYPIATVAELMGEPARSAILIALLDGRALPAGELACIAGISAQSASGHFSKLVDGGLLAVESSGRHRYYRMASPHVAHALEALGAISTLHRPLGTLANREPNPLYTARSCYDHLAGRIGVELTEALQSAKVIRARSERIYELGVQGKSWLTNLGVNIKPLQRSRRSFARQCLDWTERKPHIAGALGAALLSRLLAMGWFARLPKTRALRITHRGARELHLRFGIAAIPRRSSASL